MYNREFFDAGLYRMGTDCEKWDVCRREHGTDVLPMWVADMDFASPKEVRDAILARAAHPTYGYTEVTDADVNALIGFWERRHGLKVDKEAVLSLPCVVTGLKTAICALTKPGDGVIILSPVYGPFRMSVEVTGRALVDCPLKKDASGHYDMDLNAVETALQSGAKLMMLCNPHNPVSRCWTRDELQALVDLTAKYSVPLVSDEIHADFVFAPHTFTPILSLTTKNVFSLCAASKTFNLAGLQQANCLCPDPELRAKLQAQLDAAGVVSGNIFALEATRAAYEHGDAWLNALLDYLKGNCEELRRTAEKYLPKAVLSPMDATYLGWLDMSAYGLTTAELMERSTQAGVVFTSGTFFGAETGEGFLRVNVACPRSYIEEGMRRLAKAVCAQ